MMTCLKDHGPDRTSFLELDGYACAHGLLTITEQDTFEIQPVVTPDGKYCLVVDARIDNRAELAVQLGISSGNLETLPDSAFVAKAWERWGRDCVHHLIGAFALAVWNKQARELFLARDHSGERTLFFSKTSSSFIFATTVRAILSCPGVSGELDEFQIGRDLVGLTPDPFRTRFRDVAAVAAGHFIVVRQNEMSQTRYWQFDRLAPIRFRKDEDYVQAFLEIFDEAVRCRLRAVGPIASELSAGLDSGAVTSTAAILLGDQGLNLRSFTSVPRRSFVSDSSASGRLVENEGPYAAEVAAMYPNIQHTSIDSSGSDMLHELERLFRVLDIPCATALNAIWCNGILDKVSSAGGRVLLTGALGNHTMSYAGDEVLYPLFKQNRWLDTIRRTFQLRKAGLSSGRTAASLTLFAALPWQMRIFLDPSIRTMTLEETALQSRHPLQSKLLDEVRRYRHERSTDLPRCQETYFHANQYGDYNAAANAGWNVEVRDPTADKRVYEFCASIPQEQYFLGGMGRSLIRRAMRGRLPESTLLRTAKGTQSADWYESLTEIHQELSAEILKFSQSPMARSLLDLDKLHKAVASWPRTKREAMTAGNALYQYALPRGVACGYFIRRAEEAFLHS